MRKAILLALTTVFASSLMGLRLAAQNLGTVSVQVAPLGRLIPKDFSGFSIEVRAAARAYLGPPGQPNRVFYQLLENLGAGSIRIGGDSQDLSCWNPQQAPQPDRCRFTLTPADVEGFAQASAATGWPVIVGVNLAQNSASWALPYGVAVEKAFAGTPGSRLAGFEIGNEPDIYYRHFTHPRAGEARPYFPLQPASHRFMELARVGERMEGLRRRLRGRPRDEGRSSYGSGDLLQQEFSRRARSISRCRRPGKIRLGDRSQLPHHDVRWPHGNYRAASQPGRSRSMGEIRLVPSCGGPTARPPAAHGRDEFCFVQRPGGRLKHVRRHRLGPRLDVRQHQARHDRRELSHGCTQHLRCRRRGNSKASDGSVSYTDAAWPLYYAVYAFAKLAEGRSLLPVTTATNANIAAYAVRASSSAPVRVFLINKDMKAAGNVSIHTSEAMGQAAALMVRAENLGSKQVSYGGVQFDNTTGRLTGTPHETGIAPDSQGDYAVELPNAAIAVVTIQPK